MAMSKLNVVCAQCGDQAVAARDITLEVCYQKNLLSRYSFTCPACRTLVSDWASPDIITNLLMNKVAPVTIYMPHVPPAPPLIPKDLRVFRAHLEALPCATDPFP